MNQDNYFRHKSLINKDAKKSEDNNNFLMKSKKNLSKDMANEKEVNKKTNKRGWETDA